MNPLEPNDPLWNLLGKAREIKVRGNFTQDVVRAARNEPQERGFIARCRAWLSESVLSTPWLRPITAAALLAGAAAAFWPTGPAENTLALTAPAAPVATDLQMGKLAEALPTLPLDTIAEMDALLAMDDSSAMSDNELAFLLY